MIRGTFSNGWCISEEYKHEFLYESCCQFPRALHGYPGCLAKPRMIDLRSKTNNLPIKLIDLLSNNIDLLSKAIDIKGKTIDLPNETSDSPSETKDLLSETIDLSSKTNITSVRHMKSKPK